MGFPARKIETEALKLNPKQRARIAERLLSSLDDQVDPEHERLWQEEAERRLDELLTGKIKGIPADQVIKRARSTLR